MSTPADESAFLHGLELNVKAELTLAETGEPQEEALGVPIDEWLVDPADAQRYEAGLGSLLGAVEAMEDGSQPGDHPPSTEARARVTAGDHGLSRERAAGRPTGAARYGRMFPDLDPLDTDPRRLMRAGGNGGICDAAAVPGQLNPGGGDATEAAGWPFSGQLIAHDITADRSPIASGIGPEALHNARTPKLDLEMIYSDGPIGSPYLFDLGDPAKFLLGPGRGVPRNQQGVALIGDPRNDSHLFALTLHVALLHAHNRVVDLLRENGVPEADVFDKRRSIRLFPTFEDSPESLSTV